MIYMAVNFLYDLFLVKLFFLLFSYLFMLRVICTLFFCFELAFFTFHVIDKKMIINIIIFLLSKLFEICSRKRQFTNFR